MSKLEERKTYYPNGQINVHCYYVNGELNGEYKSYHYNGQLGVNCYYLNGKLHGECKSYYDNGQLNVHGYYLNDSNVTDELVKEYDLSDLSKEDKLAIKLKWGI